jgi:hypothetical protein
LRPKPRNSHGDFETEISKPELPVLRPKPGNPPPPWFLGSTKKPTAGIEVKPGETVATSFEAKLKKTVATGFEAKPEKTTVAGFEAKPAKTVQVVLRPNHSQTVAIGFDAQTDEKPSTLVLRLNQETCTPRLHVHGVQTAHGTTQPLDRLATEYSTCATIPGPLHQVSYSCNDLHRCTSCRTCHLHTTKQANVILQMKQR